MEYAWFNNVETKPDWATRITGKTRRNGKAAGSKNDPAKWFPVWVTSLLLTNFFANPDQPELDDYDEPFTYGYDLLKNAPKAICRPPFRAH
ncbi:hypothetical protein ACNKHW_07615 [Shigella flexneri]